MCLNFVIFQKNTKLLLGDKNRSIE